MAELDWNAPLLDAFTNMPVHVMGKSQHYLIVRDYKGRRLAFLDNGVSVDGKRRVVNADPAIVLKQLIVALISARVGQLAEFGAVLAEITMEEASAWGTF